MNNVTMEAILSSFSSREDSAFKTLEGSINTTHWRSMIGDRSAVECKCNRSQYILDKLELHGKRVLDFGSGMGFLSNYLAWAGSGYVVGIEVLPESRATATALQSEVFKTRNVEFLPELPQDSIRFDAALLCNVISHLHRPIEVLTQILALLRPGGKLFIEDNNNFQSPLVRRRNLKLWNRTDIEYFPSRLRHVESADSLHPPGTNASDLAHLTYGLTYEEISTLITASKLEYLTESDLRWLRTKAPIDPDTNIYHENAFTADEVECILFNMGCIIREKIPKHVFDFRSHPFVSWCFRSFPRLALHVSPAFEVIAVKK